MKSRLDKASEFLWQVCATGFLGALAWGVSFRMLGGLSDNADLSQLVVVFAVSAGVVVILIASGMSKKRIENWLGILLATILVTGIGWWVGKDLLEQPRQYVPLVLIVVGIAIAVILIGMRGANKAMKERDARHDATVKILEKAIVAAKARIEER